MDPKTDPVIPFRYDAATLEAKYENKKALRKRLNLKDAVKPIVCSVGRLDAQKGIHLLQHALTYALSHGAQFVLLGSGLTPQLTANLKHSGIATPITATVTLSSRITRTVAFVLCRRRHDCGASIFEPCGLTQMMRSIWNRSGRSFGGWFGKHGI